MREPLSGKVGHWVLVLALSCLVLGFGLQLSGVRRAVYLVWASLGVGLGTAALRYGESQKR